MSAATIDRYLAPAGARAVRGRSTTKAGPGLRSSIKIRRAGGRGGGRARASSRPVTVAHCGPVLEAGSRARIVEHDPMCSRGGPSPARSAGVADKAHHLGPRRRRGRDPVPRAGHGLRQRVGIHRPRRGAVGREPGASTPARSRPHGKNDQATIETREQPRGAPLRLPATATDADAEHRVPGRLWESVDTRVNYPGPHPQAHRVGRRQGRWAQAPVRPAPHTPRPAAGHRRPGRRPEGRIDRLPQPAQPRRHHPPHHRAPGRPRPPGQGQDRPAPASPRSPASCPTSARASGSGEPPRPPPITRAVPREAPKKFRGHLDMRHPEDVAPPRRPASIGRGRPRPGPIGDRTTGAGAAGALKDALMLSRPGWPGRPTPCGFRRRGSAGAS